jgi:MFS family permease
MLAGMLWMHSYGAYVVLLQDEFGWSKAIVAGAFALTRIESGLLGPLQGWLVDRFGPRSILRIGTIMFGVGFMLFGLVESILTFYLTFALIAVGSSLGGFPTLMVSVVNWFQRHRAKAIALSQIGFSFGGLLVPIIILSLEIFGWRSTAIASGVIVIIVGLPLAQLVRHRPEDHGDTPDGIANDTHQTTTTDAEHTNDDFTAREAMGTQSFWLLSIGHALSLLTVSTVMVHLVPHLIEGLNYSLASAGGIIALITGCQMIGQLLGGYLGDRVDKRLICVACMLGHGAGLVLVAFATTPYMVIAFALLHGLSWGARGPLLVALRADYFGAAAFGTIIGFSSLIMMFGMASGPIIAGLMADISGDYKSAFTLIGASTALGSLCFFAARRPSRSGYKAAH